MKSIDSLLQDASSFIQSEFNLKLQKSRLKPYSLDSWQAFCQANGFDVNSEGLYVPASYSAYVKTDSPVLVSNIFHELYGHGLFVEHSSIGKKLIEIINASGDEQGFMFDEVNPREQVFGIARHNIHNYEGFAVKISPTCRAPEILVGNSCCLDENYNKICDNKEKITITPASNTQVSLPDPQCGDGQCYITERNNCCQDCGCPTDFSCQENGLCIRIPSRPFFSPSTMPDSYIVITLDEMIIHDDEDPAAAGELQLITLAATGDKAQTMYWPAGLWRPVDSGNSVLGGNILEKIPVFSLKENQMGEKLAISFRAIDNDDLPNWLEGFIDILSAPFGVLASVVEFLADLAPLPPLEGMVYLENQLESAFNELIADNEEIGSVTQIYDRSQDWGVREEPYIIRKGGLTVKYTIHRISVPKNSKLGVKLWKVVVRDTGDYYDGEVWFWMRCANNFGEQKIDEIRYRIPRSGTFDWGDGQTLEGVPGPTIEVSPGVLETTTLPIIECKNNGPFNFFEVAVWDEDEPNVGDDHDLIGHFTETVLYSESDIMLGRITVPRGNIDVWLEYTKE